VFGNKDGVAFATEDQTLDREDERERVIRAGGIVYRDKSISEERLWGWRINCLNMSRSIGDGWSKGKFSHISGKKIPAIRMRRIQKDEEIMVCLEQWPNIKLHNGFQLNPQIGQVIAEPEYKKLSLTDVHRWLIIATDGLWNTVQNEEAVTMVQNYYDNKGYLQGIAHYLCQYAIEKGSEDNIAVFVVDLLRASNNEKI
jgi:serine/threonine protein phosphatase PrpC